MHIAVVTKGRLRERDHNILLVVALFSLLNIVSNSTTRYHGKTNQKYDTCATDASEPLPICERIAVCIV